jgi:hypothetical protein
VERAAEAALADQRYVSAVDVLVRLGWLAPTHVDHWRQGRVDCLERMAQANLIQGVSRDEAFGLVGGPAGPDRGVHGLYRDR